MYVHTSVSRNAREQDLCFSHPEGATFAAETTAGLNATSALRAPDLGRHGVSSDFAVLKGSCIAEA